MRNLKPLLGLANADNHTLRIDQASSPLYSAFNRVSCVNTCGKVYCRYSEKTEFNSFFFPFTDSCKESGVFLSRVFTWLNGLQTPEKYLCVWLYELRNTSKSFVESKNHCNHKWSLESSGLNLGPSHICQDLVNAGYSFQSNMLSFKIFRKWKQEVDKDRKNLLCDKACNSHSFPGVKWASWCRNVRVSKYLLFHFRVIFQWHLKKWQILSVRITKTVKEIPTVHTL